MQKQLYRLVLALGALFWLIYGDKPLSVSDMLLMTIMVILAIGYDHVDK
jgi:hypothetical protein